MKYTPIVTTTGEACGAHLDKQTGALGPYLSCHLAQEALGLKCLCLEWETVVLESSSHFQ